MDLRTLFKTFDRNTAKTQLDDWLRRAHRNSPRLTTVDHIFNAAKNDPFTGCVAWLALTYHAIDKGSQSLFGFMTAETNDEFLNIAGARRKFHVPLILYDLNCYSTEVLFKPLWGIPRDYLPDYLYEALRLKTIQGIISKLHWIGLKKPGPFTSKILSDLIAQKFVDEWKYARIPTPQLILKIHRVLEFYYVVVEEFFKGLQREEIKTLAEVMWRLRGSKKWESWYYLNSKKKKMGSGKDFPWPGGACRDAEDMEKLFGSMGTVYMKEVHNLLKMTRPIVSWEEGLLLTLLLAGSRGDLSAFSPEGFSWVDVSRILSKICGQTQRLQSILGIVRGDDPFGIVSGEEPKSRTCKKLADALDRFKRSP